MMVNISRRERQKMARREAILQAARQVFLSGNGYHTTVATVARHANVSKGTVYLYFENKESLLAELLHEGLQLLNAQLTAAYSAESDLTPDIRVARLAGAFLEFAQSQVEYIRLNIAFGTGQMVLSAVPSQLAGEIDALNQRGVTLMTAAIQTGIDEKVFRRVKAEQVASALWVALVGALLATIDDRSQTDLQEADTLFQTTLEMFLRALKRTR